MAVDVPLALPRFPTRRPRNWGIARHEDRRLGTPLSIAASSGITGPSGDYTRRRKRHHGEECLGTPLSIAAPQRVQPRRRTHSAGPFGIGSIGTATFAMDATMGKRRGTFTATRREPGSVCVRKTGHGAARACQGAGRVHRLPVGQTPRRAPRESGVPRRAPACRGQVQPTELSPRL